MFNFITIIVELFNLFKNLLIKFQSNAELPGESVFQQPIPSPKPKRDSLFPHVEHPLQPPQSGKLYE